MNRAMELRQELEKVQQRRAQLIREIEQIENHCKHQWKEEYFPEVFPEIRFEGDPVGTMGVDRRLPGYVPARTVPRWKRSCPECGKEEFTHRSEPVISAQKPKFDFR